MTAPAGRLWVTSCGRLVEERERQRYARGVKVRVHLVRDGSLHGWIWLEQLTAVGS